MGSWVLGIVILLFSEKQITPQVFCLDLIASAVKFDADFMVHISCWTDASKCDIGMKYYTLIYEISLSN